MASLSASILLIGAGGHAVSCIDVIECLGRYTIVGLLGRSEDMGRQVLGYSVIGADDCLGRCLDMASNALIAVGQIASPARRVALYESVGKVGFTMPSVISPMACVSPHAHIGAGSIVMHGAIVNAGAVIGENCIINSRALIEHGVHIGNHCHIATGAVLNGDVAVGEESFVGSTTVVREGVVLGQRCVVGMGLSIRHNQSEGARVVVNC